MRESDLEIDFICLLINMLFITEKSDFFEKAMSEINDQTNNSLNFFSSIIATPNSTALLYLEPGFKPTTT